MRPANYETLSWRQIEDLCSNLIVQMYNDNWRPDYIVGILRGGVMPAVKISNITGIPCESVKICLRDNGQEQESNCWMSEDAYYGKNILVLDDINDTGETLKFLKKDWEESCHPNDRETWENVWSNNVKFAVLLDNINSKFGDVSYCGREISKSNANPVWFIFPWEEQFV